MPNLTRGQVSRESRSSSTLLDEQDHRAMERTRAEHERTDKLRRLDQRLPWPTGAGGRALYAKLVAAVGIGLVIVAVSLGLQERPAGNPPRSVILDASQLDDVDALRVDPGTPTSLSSQSVEMPPTTLNPNAIFVDAQSGSADGDGTSFDTALDSLQVALDRVQPGETIYLMDGRYGELKEPRNLHYLLTTNGTADAWITIENAPGHTPVIVATDGNALEIRGSYVEVSGLTVKGEGFSAEGNPYGNGLQVRNANHIRLIGNTISNMPLSGISAIGSANVTIVDNEIFENAFWNDAQGSGISFWHANTNGEPAYSDGYHDRIIGNRIYRNENRVKSRWRDYTVITDGNGIIIDEGHDTGYDGRTLIANNVIFDNGGRGVLVYRSDAVDIMYNTVYHNGRTEGLEGGPVELAAGDANDVRFFNNLVWPREGSAGIRFGDTEQTQTGGNLVVNTGDPGMLSATDTVVTGNPGLINPSIDENVADFRPLNGTAGIGSPVQVTPRLATDRDGSERPIDTDMVGAYVGRLDE